MCINQDDNELEVLEIIHLFVEVLDRYFGSVSFLNRVKIRIRISLVHIEYWLPLYFFSAQVCELDLIFNFHKVFSFSPASLLNPHFGSRFLGEDYYSTE